MKEKDNKILKMSFEPNICIFPFLTVSRLKKKKKKSRQMARILILVFQNAVEQQEEVMLAKRPCHACHPFTLAIRMHMQRNCEIKISIGLVIFVRILNGIWSHQ